MNGKLSENKWLCDGQTILDSSLASNKVGYQSSWKMYTVDYQLHLFQKRFTNYKSFKMYMLNCVVSVSIGAQSVLIKHSNFIMVFRVSKNHEFYTSVVLSIYLHI